MSSAPDTQKLKRLSVVLPKDIADEICELPTQSKAMLLIETADDILEKLDGFPALMLSNTTTQWLRSLGMREQLQLIENLTLMLISEVKQ